MTIQFKAIFNKFDTNNNGKFEWNEISNLLEKVFNFSRWEASRLVSRIGYCKSFTYNEFMKVFLGIYFEKQSCGKDLAIDGILTSYTRLTKWSFVERILRACYFIRFKPPRKDLEDIFDDIKGCYEYIEFRHYIIFIKNSLCKEEEEQKKEEKSDWQNFDYSTN